jgi:Flp pilus assembly protein TadG
MRALEWILCAAASVRRGCARLSRDRRGVAAVEFAYVAPILLVLYFVTMETAQAIDSNKKVARVASMVADLVTQQQEMSKTELDAIMKIGESIIQPYNRTNSRTVVTAIEVPSDPASPPKIAWSRKFADGVGSKPYAVGSPVTIPTAVNVPNSLIIRVESEMTYRPMISWTASQKEALSLGSMFDTIEMKDAYYLRPRMSTTIPCKDC